MAACCCLTDSGRCPPARACVSSTATGACDSSRHAAAARSASQRARQEIPFNLQLSERLVQLRHHPLSLGRLHQHLRLVCVLRFRFMFCSARFLVNSSAELHSRLLSGLLGPRHMHSGAGRLPCCTDLTAVVSTTRFAVACVTDSGPQARTCADTPEEPMVRAIQHAARTCGSDRCVAE